MMNKKKTSAKTSPMKQTSKAAMMKKEGGKMSPAKMKKC
jgi:hypothetical protein